MIVGLLPMGGQGTRLAQPVPKPLMPTITDAGIVPLYRHALGQLEGVCDRIFAMTTPTTNSSIRELGLEWFDTDEPILAGAFGVAGRYLGAMFGPDTLVAMAFPDSIWMPDEDSGTLADVVTAVRGDGALGIFLSGADELDFVTFDHERVHGIITKEAGATGLVMGWGAFVIRASALARMTAAEKDGPQLGRLDLGWAFLGRYVDLGTPERYIRAHDQREGSR